MTTAIKGPLEVPLTKEDVKDYLSVCHYNLSLLEVISKLKGKDFTEDNIEMITEVFKLGFYYGWNESYQEWMCEGEEYE